jgi:hypothetical protein
MNKNKKTASELETELLQTIQEVGEILKKSGLAKAEEDEVGSPDEAHAEPDADQQGGPSDQDADNMPPAQPEGEAQPEGQPAEQPAQPEQGDEASEMAAHAAELSDEELQAMLEVLMAEVEKRHAGAGAEQQPAAQPAEQAPAQPEEEKLAASMKSELSTLAKSVAEIAEAVKSLSGDVGTLKKSQSAKSTTVVTKPAATRNVQVLQKSEQAKERLNKSDTLNFLLSEQKNGNKRVNSDVIATVNACRSDSDLHDAQKNIEKLGIKLP